MTAPQVARRLVVLVSNDLSFDQRVRKSVATFEANGWEVDVVGRLLPNSVDVPWTARSTRYKLPFQNGPLFYAALQCCLVWDLIKRRNVGAIWANDLDTLMPARLVGRIFGIPVVYDSHEFFTEAEGLTGRPIQRGVWLLLERLIMPGCKAVITVNDGIADALRNRYPTGRFGRPYVVRNMPFLRSDPFESDPTIWDRYGISTERPIVLLQGAFMDRDRGAKRAVESLVVLEDVTLVLVGAGPEFEWAKGQLNRFPGRLHCLPRLPFDELARLTASADCGLSLDSSAHGNFYMSLPNKVFDYIHAGLPVVASDLPEVRRIVTSHGVGQIAESLAPADIAIAIQHVLMTPRSEWKKRCNDAAQLLHWERDAPRLLEALDRASS